jgi:hypothetical protein
LYTTGERLLQSETINELTVYGEERDVLWQALRERALEKQTYNATDLPEFPLDPEIMALFGLSSKRSQVDD